MSDTTAPFHSTPAHKWLNGLVGRWVGTTRTWLDPSAPPAESPVEVTITSLFGGRWIRLAYASTVSGTPHAGDMTIGVHKDVMQYELAWIDSFHTGSSIMISVGRPGGASDGQALDVLGSYAAGAERWGWRTLIRTATPNEIVIEALNVRPSGEEDPAAETRLRRV